MANKKHSELANHVVEALQDLGPVRARAMFGGYGIYLGELMFGLIAEEVFYLKVDATTLPRFEAAGLKPFVYTGGGRTVSMSYHRAPTSALDDEELLLEWARIGVEAATRAKMAGGIRKRRSSKS